MYADRVLRLAGYETALAGDAAAALALSRAEQPFDLLLTDLMMPEMCGDELAQILHQRTPDLKVVYLTGFSERLFSTRPFLWSNETFVDKPVSVVGLRDAVSMALFGHTRGVDDSSASITN